MLVVQRIQIACWIVGLTLVWVVLSACQPKYNDPLGSGSRHSDFQSTQPTERQDDQALVLVALSGGGTRAAAVGWKTLETLQGIPYTYKNKEGQTVISDLGHEIDLISGISGGCFAAAAWSLYRDDIDYFRKNFIERNIQGTLAKAPFIPPWQGLRLLSPEYDRINLAAELYDEEVFGGKTFSALPPRPLLRIHATHLALGMRFTFTNKQFDYLDSDLSTYPIGYACAASSAFPILLSPITLKNFGESRSLDDDIEYRMAKLNARKDVERDFYRRMREFYNDKSNEYVHLADGGLVDNQGLQSILDEFETNGIINMRLNDRDNPLKRLIIINVNAGVKPDDEAGKSASAPGVGSVIEYTMVASMDLLSAKRWMEIQGRCAQVDKAVSDLAGTTRSLSELESAYCIEVSFRNIDNDADRVAANKLPTSFHLEQEQLALIDRVVPDLVCADPDMKRLLETLGIGPDKSKSACVVNK
jgi:NTE family protein